MHFVVAGRPTSRIWEVTQTCLPFSADERLSECIEDAASAQNA